MRSHHQARPHQQRVRAFTRNDTATHTIYTTLYNNKICDDVSKEKKVYYYYYYVIIVCSLEPFQFEMDELYNRALPGAFTGEYGFPRTNINRCIQEKEQCIVTIIRKSWRGWKIIAFYQTDPM